MKKILFPTDFSETAKNAFVHALGLASLIDGELILLHTYELPIVDNQFAPQNYQVLFDSLQLSNFERFKNEVTELRILAKEHHFEAIKMSHIITDGDLIHSIKETIKKNCIDYVVMGTSGALGWKKAFLGTNTGEAITQVNIPVLSVPNNSKFIKIETFGFTTRYREKDKEALKQVLKIAKLANAKVKCLYVKTKDADVTDATIADWKEQFKNEPITFFNLPSEDVKECIIDFIAHQEIDVLAMLTYKRNFFETFFSSSLTEDLSFYNEIPILAMH